MSTIDHVPPAPRPANRPEPAPGVGPLCVIGGGSMGSAILAGARAAGVLDGPVIIAEPDAARRAAAASVIPGCVALPSASAALDELSRVETSAHPGLILLAIKPQKLADVAQELAKSLISRATSSAPRPIASILAGVPLARLAAALHTPRVVRVMPNTPARLGRSVSALCPAPGATADDLARVTRLFAAVGTVVPIREDLMDAFTALAGSGPAYVFLLAQAMIRAAQELGFSPEDADAIVRSTIEGAAALLTHDSGTTPAELRRAVTSPGGVTEAACRVLDAAGVQDAFVRAITAGRDRGSELGRELGRDLGLELGGELGQITAES